MYRFAITALAFWANGAIAQDCLLKPVDATCISSPFGPRTIQQPSMRSGGDAGTAIHTPVPFRTADIMASISIAVKTSAAGADTDKKRRRVDCPAP